MTFLRLPVLSAALACLALADPDAAAGRTSPNVVVILVDDLGYGDVDFGLETLSVFRNPYIRTPNLARLASESLVLTHHYSASPVCSPARAGLLTGRIPARSAIDLYINDLTSNEKSFLHGSEITIAELLAGRGYRTGIFGKWHLNGADWEDPAAWTGWTGSFPGQQGFADGIVSKENPHFTRQLKVNTQKHPGDFFTVAGEPMGALKGYTSDIISTHAIRWLDRMAAERTPFFLFLPYDAPHIRVAAADRYEDLYDTGDARRDAYLANVTHLDAAIGVVLDHLEHLGLADDTLVYFSSDNGPDVLREIDFSLFCHGTAYPLRGAKFQLYEGGIRVPTLVRWPGRIRPRISDTPGGFVDVLPTLAALTGFDVPADRAIDGVSLLDNWLSDAPVRRHQPLYWQHHHTMEFAEVVGEGYLTREQGRAPRPTLMPVAALREGPFMLLASGERPARKPVAFALFNVVDDPGQTTDLSDREPRRAAAMRAALLAIEEDVARERAATEAAISARSREVRFR